MYLWRFILLDSSRSIFSNWRWLLPFPILLLSTYVEATNILNQASSSQAASNAWDLVFGVFGNHRLLYFVMNPLFIYLCCGLLPEDGFGRGMVQRLRSRSLWWGAKISVLTLKVICYISIFVITVMGIATLILPWEKEWSQAILGNLTNSRLTPDVVTISPLFAILQFIMLLGLGWFFLGILSLVTIQLSRRSIWGLSVGIFVNICGLAANRAGVKPPLSLLFIDQHMLLNRHAFGNTESQYPSVNFSIAYWIICISILFIVGLFISKSIDFYSKKSQG